ncbi:MAG TPA: 7-carboxy-7-deazaguanine synthase QueE, partial [Persephonella sp.]|nr:7-carboxy-7-deazaguanine synthase QueE [Persephonella sp.]
MTKLKVVEIFRTVEGEGKWVGLPVSFIRLEGC